MSDSEQLPISDLLSIKEAAKKQIDAVRAQLKKQSEVLLAELLKPVFDLSPDILSVSWDQYVPYFNDGQACTFSAHVEEPIITIRSGDDEVRCGNCGDGKGTSEQEELGEKASDLAGTQLSVLDDDDFEMFFGDSVTVSISRDGTLNTKHCDHD